MEWTYVGSATDNDEEKDSPEWLEKFLKWLFGNFIDGDASSGLKIFEIVIWLAVAVIVVWLINKYSHWLSWINLQPRLSKKAKSIPNIILGMDITQESLPDDVLATFSNYINNKQYREALSLLYRATLSAIIHRGDIDIPTSATERECSNMIADKRSKDESNFFKALTNAWVMLAYADRSPSVETLSHLREGWTRHYQNSEYKENS